MDLSSKHEQMKSEYFKTNLSPLKRIYVDMGVVQDYNIGALLCMIKTDLELKHIRNNIANYNARYDDGIVKYFPKLKFTDQDVYDFINEPDNHFSLVRVSPFTNYMDVLRELIISSKDALEIVEGSEAQAQVVFGCNYVPYDNVAKQNLLSHMVANDSTLKCTVLDKSIFLMKKDYLDSFDAYLIDKLDKLLQMEEVGPFVVDELAWINKAIVSPPRLRRPLEEGEQLKDVLMVTENSLDCLFDFKYVQCEVII